MNKKTSRGFSLLEIIIAMLILSLVVTGMVGLFVSSNRFIIQAGHRLAALNYGREVAETLKVYVSASPTVGTLTNAGTGGGCALDGPVDTAAFDDSDADGVEGLSHDPTTTIGLDVIDIPGVTGETCTYNVLEDVRVGGNTTTLEQVTVTVQWTEP